MTARRVCPLLFLGAALVWSPVGGLLEFQPRGGDCRASRRGQRSGADLREGRLWLVLRPPRGLQSLRAVTRTEDQQEGKQSVASQTAKRGDLSPAPAWRHDSLTAAPLPPQRHTRAVTVCHIQPSSSRRSSASCCASDTAEASNTIPSSINQIKARISQFALKPDLIFLH